MGGGVRHGTAAGPAASSADPCRMQLAGKPVKRRRGSTFTEDSVYMMNSSSQPPLHSLDLRERQKEGEWRSAGTQIAGCAGGQLGQQQLLAMAPVDTDGKW